MIADKAILELQAVELRSKKLLPASSGIYYVVDTELIVWYIGYSININKRWNSDNSHHRYHQLINISNQENKILKIYFLEINNKIKYLRKIEKEHIEKYNPILNNTPVIQNLELTRDFTVKIPSIKAGSLQTKYMKPLPIFSDKYKVDKKANIFIKQDNNKDNDKSMIMNSIKKFQRRFIDLKDINTGLNLQMEFCINSQDRIFVRHYIIDIVNQYSLREIDSLEAKIVEEIISSLYSQYKNMYPHSIKWLGYKLKCEEVLLLDEEEGLEMQAFAIMIPFSMFVDLIEDKWMRTDKVHQMLHDENTNWHSARTSIKLARWLHENTMNFYQLVDEYLFKETKALVTE